MFEEFNGPFSDCTKHHDLRNNERARPKNRSHRRVVGDWGCLRVFANFAAEKMENQLELA
jgi:hypothetical protein